MKNPITILLISLHLLAYTDFSQLIKFPQLLNHYQEHLSQNPQLPFLDFLVMHYGKLKNGNDNPDKEDMKLPFKTIAFHITAQAAILPHFSFHTSLQFETMQPFTFNYHHLPITANHEAGIFRPPIITA
ncbi:MAG TPA: hypothetical protein VLR49_09380 [Ferruginibacter sp.]|nr:hypothetical protein [Ferruginibacter sp.]